MGTVLQIEGLRKSYATGRRRPPRPALKGLDLEVRRGSVFGLLGPNGAGKTTTLKVIMGLVRPDAGRVTVLGRQADDLSVRSRIGFLPEQPYFELYMTPRRLLTYYGRLAGMSSERIRERIPYLLNLVGLGDVTDLRLEKFSKGMLQRVGLAQALLNRPELVILDEPSSGLDPLGKIEVKEILDGLRREGVTVLLSSHQLSEVEEVCDRVAIISGGENVASGGLDDLLRSKDEFRVVLAGPLLVEKPLLPPSASWSSDGRTLYVKRESLSRVLRSLIDAGIGVEEVAPRRMTLEEFFLSRVKPAREGEDV